MRVAPEYVVALAFAAGLVTAHLPTTAAGFACGYCFAFLVGAVGSRQFYRELDRRRRQQ